MNHCPHNLAALAATGFWFCPVCERVVTEPGRNWLDDPCCPECKAPRLLYCPPAWLEQPHESRD